MSFFDQKQEVIDIELTPYGRYLFSLGRFKPAMYSFFDDDVVYDSNTRTPTGTVYPENQRSIEGRVKEKTPYLHTYFSNRGRKANYVYLDRLNAAAQDPFEKYYSLSNRLGNSSYFSNLAPAWDIHFLKGDLTSSVPNYTGTAYNLPIPQLDPEKIKYEAVLGNVSPLGSGPDTSIDDNERSVYEYNDGTFLEIREDFLLLEINEINGLFQKENFEIEVFEVTEETQGVDTVERLKPLLFNPPAEANEGYVDYHLTIEVDDEINNEVLCKYKGVDDSKGVFLKNIFDCDVPGPGDDASADQYSTSITSGDVGDICD